jgi:hypothetical protein
METKFANRSASFDRNTQNCIVLLERNNQDLLQLKNQLRCYTCEPKTYSMYEQFTLLKERLDTSFAYNLDLISAIQRGKKIVENHFEIVAAQIRTFNELKRGVMAYRSHLKNV